MYPQIKIDLGKLKHNVEALLKLTQNAGISLMAVTKGFCAHPEICRLFIEAGIDHFGDSRIENLIKLKDFSVKKTLLRLPMLSQVDQVVRYADYSVNSELKTIQALNQAAEKIDIIHKIILMIDMGDLREGIFYQQELGPLLDRIMALRHIRVAGVGTNLTCFGGVLPDEGNMGEFVRLAEEIENQLGYPLEIVSGGNSSSIPLLLENKIPTKINQFRLGEAILLGTESAYGTPIHSAEQNAFQLVAEIIEVQEKPSMPIGTINRDAFGNTPHFQDQGIMKRGIIGVGKQDVATHLIYPVDSSIQVLGGSSDHMILNIDACQVSYEVGDKLSFNLNYGSMLALMTSEYIYKNFV